MRENDENVRSFGVGRAGAGKLVGLTARRVWGFRWVLEIALKALKGVVVGGILVVVSCSYTQRSRLVSRI